MDIPPQRRRDPATLAAEVRALATIAYQAVNDPATRATEFRAISRRISRLQGEIPGRPSDDLSRWLENLRRRVDAPSAAFLRRPPSPVAASPRDPR